MTWPLKSMRRLPAGLSEMKSRRFLLRSALLLPLLGLEACATLSSDFKKPGVRLISVTPQLRNLFAPEFDVILEITNPNREALDIVGISYTISLQGVELVDGVANDLPTIEAYGKARVSLNAVADLASGFNLLSDLMQQPTDEIDFEMNADIDLGTFYPMLKVRRSGVISLQ